MFSILFSRWWILFQYKLVNLETTTVFSIRWKWKWVRECAVCYSNGNKFLKLYVKMAFAYSVEKRQLWTKGFCVHTCAELQVQVVSHELGFNWVIMEGWEEGLCKRAATKPANIRKVTDFFPSFHTQSFFLVLCICLPHVLHISAWLFIALTTFTLSLLCHNYWSSATSLWSEIILWRIPFPGCNKGEAFITYRVCGVIECIAHFCGLVWVFISGTGLTLKW